jgi:hypothetical protein
LEPISPELALIDPELARADLARLAAPTVALEIPAAPVQLPGSAQGIRESASPPWYIRAVWAILLVSLAANGFAAAMLAAELSRDRPVLIAPSPAAKGAPLSPTPATATAASTSQSSLNSTPAEAAASVERRILSMIVQSPRKRLLAALVDRRTGLAKNNLQAVCTQQSGTYLCVVRPAQHRPGEGLHVRYRPGHGGHGIFTWYPYRHG